MSYSRLTASQTERERRKHDLELAFNDVGGHRALVEGLLLDDNVLPDDDVAVTVRFASAVASLTRQGKLVDAGKDENVFSVNDVFRHNVPGAVPGNKKLGDLIIPCGVCLIVGPGGVGKTPLAHALAAHGVDDHYGVVRIGEPLAGYTSSDKSAAEGIAQALLHESNIVVDSIKDLLASGSNAMKSGITRQSLVTLSDWSTTACDLGSTLYIPVNPSSVSDEVMDLLAEAARSNATATLIHEAGNRWTYYGRTGEGMPRVRATIHLTEDGGVTAEGEVKPISEARATVAIVGSLDQYKGAIYRAIVQDQDQE